MNGWHVLIAAEVFLALDHAEERAVLLGQIIDLVFGVEVF